MILQAVLSALVNVVLLAAIPLGAYYAFHRLRHGRGWGEVAERAGLRLGPAGPIVASAAVGATIVAAIVLWGPPTEPFVRQGSAFRSFAGLGLGSTSVLLALIYGMVKTGFAEELLFRGLIAGSLSRRLPMIWANLLQATIFLLPHLAVLFFMPEFAPLLALIFGVALFKGWARIRSGSIVGPGLLHGMTNVAMALYIAARTA